MHYPRGVTYDRALKVLTVSPSAWMGSGPVRWLDNYRIISSVDNPIADRLQLIDIRDYVEEGEVFKRAVQETYESPAYQRMIDALKMQDYVYLPDRAGPHIAPGPRVLVNEYAISRQFENKVWIRETFGNQLQFADFQLVEFGNLSQALAEESVVVQHAQLGGGKGTFFVSDQSSFEACRNALAEVIDDPSERVVVSKQITDAKERSIQVCVTSETVYVGPTQSQLVRHPLLVSSHPGDMQFCGGRIHEGLASDDNYQAMKKSAEIVGQALKDSGYRGIFGVDFMVNSEGVYVLEVNPRLTGLTPLLAFLQNDVPFLLLHILELAKRSYEVNLPDHPSLESGSFIELYAQEEGLIDIETGVYNQQLEKVGEGFESETMFPDDVQNFFVGVRINPGDIVKRGKSICFIYSKQQLFNDESQLSPSAELFVNRLRKKFTPQNGGTLAV